MRKQQPFKVGNTYKIANAVCNCGMKIVKKSAIVALASFMISVGAAVVMDITKKRK